MENGPYWETSFVYFDALGDTPHTLYLSYKAIIRTLLADGAPDILEHEHFKPRVQERVEQLVQERLAEKQAELEETRERLETLRRAVEPMRVHFGNMMPPEKRMGRPRKSEPVVEAAGLDAE
jgi:hypothetical protein